MYTPHVHACLHECKLINTYDNVHWHIPKGTSKQEDIPGCYAGQVSGETRGKFFFFLNISGHV